jgi:hypothetical protein
VNVMTQFTTPVLAFISTLVFGFWLSKVGKPYNGILFNVHKLIALGTVIRVTMQIYGMLKILELQVLFIILMIIAGICVVALFASGAFMSIGNLNYVVMLAVHRVALALGSITIVMLIYFLYRSLL